MSMIRHCTFAGAMLAAVAAVAHDEDIGARYVRPSGANATDCLDHHAPCQSIQYALAQAEPGHTVKVGEGIYDMSGVDPETYLFGTNKAAGGYADNFHEYDPDTHRTILVGVDPRYRAAMARQGFKWAENRQAAEDGLIDDSTARSVAEDAIRPR